MKYTIDISGPIVPNDLMWYYETMGEDATCPNDVTMVLDNLTAADEVEININSPGGVIEAGSEIYTAIRKADADHEIRIYVTGQACSAASVIACAAYCEMSPTALMMVHCVSTLAQGNHNDMEKTAEILETADRALCSAYVQKSGMSREEALLMMENETWLTAEQAVERGLVDKIMFTYEESETAELVASMFELPSEEQMNRARAMIEDRARNKRKAAAKLNILKHIPFQ